MEKPESNQNDLERTRCLQQMIFGSQAGEYLRELLEVGGHFIDEQETEAHRVEQNLVKRIMQACGATVEFKPKALPAQGEPSGNVVDDILEGDEP